SHISIRYISKIYMYARVFSHVRLALRSHSTAWAVMLLPMALALPTLRDGFSMDDFLLLQALGKPGNGAQAWYDLYNFIPKLAPESILGGTAPWWSAPSLQMHLVRPLTSALLAFDHFLFGTWAVGYRAHSLLWFGLLLVLVRHLYLRLFERTVGTFALVLFALSPCLVMPVIWISARHLLVAGVAVTVGLICLIDSEDRPRRRWVAALAFAVALITSEAGLSGLAYWVAYELCAGTSGNWSLRLRRGTQPILMGVLYLAMYRVLGGGARGGGLYLDPISDPRGFTLLALRRIPTLLGDAILHVDAGMGMVWPVPVILIGLGATGLVALLFAQISPSLSPRETRALRWLVPGASLTTVGVAGGPPSSRSLTIAIVGFVPLVAILIQRGWAHFSASPGRGRHAWRMLVAFFAFAQLVYGPVVALFFGRAFRQAEPASAVIGQQTALAASHAHQVVLLTGSDFTVWHHTFGRLRPERPDQGCWWVASAAKGSHQITMTSPRSFSLELTDTELRTGAFERMWRGARYPLPVGYEVTQCGATIRVAAVRNDNPYRLDIQLNTPLNDPRLALLAWQDGRIRRVSPSELEKGLFVRWSPGPMRIF
ncbi:MAG TPA: hypothetical protein VKP30_18935, partial [Polyangiaceae bacterium]|nr:hypothetical protein [Polyangiaceae bacterium]